MDWIVQNSWALWLGLALLLVLAELVSLDLILLMLGAGAVAGMGTSLVGAGPVIQVLVASAVAVAALALVRPNLVKRLHRDTDVKFGMERLVDVEGLVTEEVSEVNPGRVQAAGESWSARTEGETLPVGTRVRIIEIKGATAQVVRVASEES